MAVATVDVLSVFTYLVLQLLKPAKTFVRRDAFCNNQRKVVATFEKLTQYGAWPTAPWPPSAKKPRIGQGQKITQGGQHLNIKGVNMKATHYASVTKLVKRAAFVLGLFTSTLATTTSLAAPLVFETEAAKIIVVRPIDLWSGDKSVLEDSLNAHKEKTVHYKVQTDSAILSGNPALFKSPSEHPLIKDVNAKINAVGFKAPMSSANAMFIHKSSSIPGLVANEFFAYQNDVYKQAVISQGNPDDLESKTSRNKVLGAALTIGTTILAGQRYGLDRGANTFLGSGSADDLYKAVASYNASLVAVEIPNFDVPTAKEVSVRKVESMGKVTGQIIIAYKDEKTEAAEHEA
ncbi:MAG: hypothetical protein EBT70_12270, partial [Betaproteobacteria bacterium]|nr:hypothetical protein [Betaproteobacteria bacterium]